MYTTCFTRVRELPSDVVPIAISGNLPEWYRGKVYYKLAPTGAILSEFRRSKDRAAFIKRFSTEVLDRLDATRVYTELCRMAGTDNIALVSHEGFGKFGHRHYVAWWLTKAGFECKEFTA